MGYLWAAYRRGAFAWEPGLSGAQFRQLVEDLAYQIIEAGGDIYTMMGVTPQGRIPVGIMTTDVVKGGDMKIQYRPHAFWFPEASARNKMECTARFLQDLKKQGNVFIASERRYWPFFQQLCKYGLIRPIGKFWGYQANGEDVMLYQGVNSDMKKG